VGQRVERELIGGVVVDADPEVLAARMVRIGVIRGRIGMFGSYRRSAYFKPPRGLRRFGVMHAFAVPPGRHNEYKRSAAGRSRHDVRRNRTTITAGVTE
jgi:hypothetical protein